MTVRALFFLLISFWGLSSAQAQTVVEKTKILFHAGTRAVLEEDIQANTIPQPAWDQFIMGSRTGFDLPEYRRGLYGAEKIHGTGLYATYNILAGREPWVVLIKVRQECVNQNGLFQSNYDVRSSAESSPKRSFNFWYHAHQTELARLAPLCLDEDVRNSVSTWKQGALYSVSESTQESIEETRICGPTLNQFLNDHQYKVVRDVVNDDSWYIRDRSCIESIEGTPDQLFLAIAKNKLGDPEENLFMNLLGDPVDPSQSSSGITYIVLKVLAETSFLNPAHLPELKDLSQGSEYKSLQAVRKAADELSLANNADSEDIVMLAFDAAARSTQKHTQQEFQRKLSSLLQKFLQETGATCKGRHGILAENRSACRTMTDSHSRKIIDFLLAR